MIDCSRSDETSEGAARANLGRDGYHTGALRSPEPPGLPVVASLLPLGRRLMAPFIPLIQKTECPERNFLTACYINIVHGQNGTVNIFVTDL